LDGLTKESLLLSASLGQTLFDHLISHLRSGLLLGSRTIQNLGHGLADFLAVIESSLLVVPAATCLPAFVVNVDQTACVDGVIGSVDDSTLQKFKAFLSRQKLLLAAPATTLHFKRGKVSGLIVAPRALGEKISQATS
jgi:hypothetical protein